MTSASPPIKILGWIIFLFFMALLTRNILFKKNLSYYKNYFRHEYKQYKVSEGWKLANTKPFHTIKLFYNSHNLSNEYKANNLLGNIIGFIPFGILLPFLLPWFRHFFKTLFAGLLLSLGYELVQLKFGLGVFDVDDLILNTAGCFVGYVLFRIGWWLFTDNKQQTNIVTDL
ncbi:MAG: VanZ family protein [Bacteroidetes bacterium]|nr:VanZ family protein [Bacteroidota bacterium]